MGITAHLPDRDPIFISSWKGFASFSDALMQLGRDHFPMIIDQLPDGDEGETTAAKARTMLDELLYFLEHQADVPHAVLVDSERGHDISMGSNVLGGVLTMDRVSGYDLGFDEQGFFVRDRLEMNRLLFQAMRVEQRLIRPEDHSVEYVDRDSDRSFQCHVPFGKPITGADGVPRMALRHFHVELRPSDPPRFAYITDPLRQALEVSVETGVTIRWV